MMSLGKNYEMAHTNIPDHCNELLAEREEAVRHLGMVANQLCNWNFEYTAAIERIMDINRKIEEAV
jgi:hypothetical protein